LEELRLDGRLMLKNRKKNTARINSGFSWVRIRELGRFCKHGEESSDRHMSRELVDRLSIKRVTEKADVP
jgi:hypothetical protein